MEMKRGLCPDERGQATVEYILLLSTVMAIFLLITQFLSNYNLAAKLTGPIQTQFKYAYQYGKTTARGYGDQGGPVNHPRISTGQNFRIFINPAPQ